MIAALGARQHGVVAMRQLTAIGLGRYAIHHRVRSGRLHRIHPGFYAVGHPKLTRQGHWMAAVLAYGPGTVLSHRTAAALWGFGHGAARIEITVPAAWRSRGTIRVHRTTLHPDEHRVKDGIPVTAVARTILDLASVYTEERLARAVEDADRLELLDLGKLERAIAHRPRARGLNRLRAVLADYQGPRDTRSDLERDFLAAIAQAGFPPPQTNVLVAGVLVDCVWPASKLVAELDSRAYHNTPRSFERDRVRDAILQRHGFRVLRVTRRRLEHAAADVLDDVGALIRPPPA